MHGHALSIGEEDALTLGINTGSKEPTCLEWAEAILALSLYEHDTDLSNTRPCTDFVYQVSKAKCKAASYQPKFSLGHNTRTRVPVFLFFVFLGNFCTVATKKNLVWIVQTTNSFFAGNEHKSSHILRKKITCCLEIEFYSFARTRQNFIFLITWLSGL